MINEFIYNSNFNFPIILIFLIVLPFLLILNGLRYFKIGKIVIFSPEPEDISKKMYAFLNIIFGIILIIIGIEIIPSFFTTHGGQIYSIVFPMSLFFFFYWYMKIKKQEPTK